VLGSVLIPGARYRQSAEGFSQGKINSKGLRDVEHDYTKSPKAYRILIIGDSFTEALQVALDSTYFRRLSRLFNGNQLNASYEIVAMGRSGMGTLEEMLWYINEGRKYHPDLVLCAFYIGNDFRDNSYELTTGMRGRVFKPFLTQNGRIDTSFVATNSFRIHSAMIPFLRLSWLSTFILRKIKLIRVNKQLNIHKEVDFSDDLSIFKKNYTEPWRQAVQTTRRILTMFNAEVQKDNARFIVVGIPDSYQIYGAIPYYQYHSMPIDLDINKPDSLLEGMAAISGFSYFSLFQCFREAFECNNIYCYGFGKMLGTGHWNERGHALAAQCLKSVLQRYLP
jgi:hypothetical protein